MTGVERTSAPATDTMLLARVTLVGPPPEEDQEVVVQLELSELPVKSSLKAAARLTWPPPEVVALTWVLLWVPLVKSATLDWLHWPAAVVNDQETGLVITSPSRSCTPLMVSVYWVDAARGVLGVNVSVLVVAL